MKKILPFLLCLGFLIATTSLTSCNRDAKCATYKGVHTKTDKKGRFKASKSKSNLFPKKMRKMRRK